MLILGTVLLLSALTTDFTSAQQATFSVRQVYGRRQTLAQLQQDNSNSLYTCAGAGHVGGCCEPDGSHNCAVERPGMNCYCSRDCYTYSDCCSDILSIGCTQTATCSDLPSISNGVISYSVSSEQKPVNTVATYSCNYGYSLTNGAAMRTCQESGWTGSPPTCERQVCPELLIEHGTVTYRNINRHIRTVATYSCEEGYLLSGIEKRICQGSTGWSGSDPVCEVVSCMIKYPGTGCTTDFTQPLLGYSDQQCSCHVGCFNQNNNLKCCEDIGCMPTTCSQAGLSQGCCSWDSQGTKHLTGCYLPGGQCYCDSGCQTAGDCCNDVPKTPTCTQSILDLPGFQSVRPRPLSRAQLVGGHGHPTRPPIVNQASRDLANELISMTQEVAESKNRWEVIASQLEKIQLQKN